MNKLIRQAAAVGGEPEDVHGGGLVCAGAVSGRSLGATLLSAGLCVVMLSGCADPGPAMPADIVRATTQPPARPIAVPLATPAPAREAADATPDTSLERLAESSGQPFFLPAPRGDGTTRSVIEQAADQSVDVQALLDAGKIERAEPAVVAVLPHIPPPPLDDPTNPGFVGPTQRLGSDDAATFDPLLDMAQRMAAMLRPGEGRLSLPPALALGPIEFIEPGVLADLESPDNVLGVKLDAADRETLVAARDEILANPDMANEALVQALAKLSPPPVLKVARSVLCSNVTSFGHYQPFTSETFLMDRPLVVVVYLELEGFLSRPARETDPAVQPGGGPQYSVDLTQSLTLFDDSSGLQVWHRPAQAIVETSRNRRRDFYTVQRVTLPSRLNVGKYNLKVTVKDRSSGSETEAVLPISIVADRSAMK